MVDRDKMMKIIDFLIGLKLLDGQNAARAVEEGISLQPTGRKYSGRHPQYLELTT